MLGTLFLLLAANYCLPYISVFTLSSVINYLFYFSTGILIKETFGGSIFKVKAHPFTKTALALLLLFVWITLLRINRPYIKTISALIGIATVYIGVQSDAVVKLFQRFGKYSLQLYLLNGFFLVISRTIIVSVLGVHDPFVIIAFNMFVDFLFRTYL